MIKSFGVYISQLVAKISTNKILQNIVENLSWLFFERIIRVSFSVLIGVWVARYLGPERFGALSFAMAYCTIFSIISALGLKDIVISEVVQNPGRESPILQSAALLQFIAGTFLCAISIYCVYIFSFIDKNIQPLIIIISFAILFKFQGVAVYWFESQVQSKYAVHVRNISLLFFSVVKISLVLSNAELIMFAWAVVAEAMFIAILFLSALVKKGPPGISKPCFKLKIMFALLAKSWPLIFTALVVVIYTRIDQLMLGTLVGSTEVGIYSAALRISDALFFVPIIIVTTLFPFIVKSKFISEKLYRARLQRLFDLVFWITVLISVVVAFFSENIIAFLFGESFSSSGSILSIHAWMLIFIGVQSVSRKWVITEQKQILELFRVITGATINILLNYILIPAFGAVGAAISTLVSHIIISFCLDIFHEDTRTLLRMKMKMLNPLGALSRASLS